MQCPSIEEECQACEEITTLIDYPLNVTNLKFEEREKQIKIFWEPPYLPSGNITSYYVFLKGNCKARDSVYCVEIEDGCETFENQTVTFRSAWFNFKPYWNYEVFVAAVNSKGSGKNVSAKYTTQKKEKFPLMTLNPQKKKFLVTLKPDCPYSGPINYTISAYTTGSQSSQIVAETIVMYDVEKRYYMKENVSLHSLEPITNYSVCISIKSTTYIPPRCQQTMTSQNRPEENPFFSTPIITESKVEFYLLRPIKAYACKNEEIKYHIEVKAKCTTKDESCTKDLNCLNEIELEKKICTSSKDNFICTFDDLQPYWQYKFRIQTENKIGTGDWSSWTSWYLTSSISNKKIETKAVDFLTDPHNKSITVNLQSYCPYPGNI